MSMVDDVRPHGPPPGLRRLAACVALLVALLCQGFLAQAHRHGDRPAAATAFRDAGSSNGVGAADCPLCAGFASAGHYLPPSPPGIGGPPPALADAAPPRTAAAGPVLARSHAWRSRGPPARPLDR